MSQRNAEQVSEAILKAVLRKSIDEHVIGDVSAQELVRLVASNFSSCPACGAEPWTNIDCRVCDMMGTFESEPRVDPIAAERERCAQICEELADAWDRFGREQVRGDVARNLACRIRGEG